MNSPKNSLLGKRVDRRRVLKGTAATGLGLGVASQAYSIPSILAQEKAPVTFWTTYTDFGFESLTLLVESYNAQSDAYAVEIVQRPPASVTDSSSLMTAVRGGEGPDVYLLDRFIVAERAAQGLLQDLTPMMEAAGDNPDLTDRYVPFAAAEAVYNGAPYALPFDTDVRMLFYNKRMLEEAGIDTSSWAVENGPITFDAAAEAFNQLNVEEGGTYSRLGFVPYYGEGWHYTYGFAFGGEFFDYENCQVTPDNERVVAAAQWVQDYSVANDADKMYAFVQNAMRDGAPPTDNPFIQGRLGGYISGNWMFAQFRNYMGEGSATPQATPASGGGYTSEDVGYTFIPVPNEGDDPATWAGGWSGVIPQGAQNVEGGYDFLKYLCGPEASRAYVERNNNLPVLTELTTDTELLGPELSWAVENLFPTTHFRPPLPVGAKYWVELTTAWQSIYLNQATPEEALGQAKENTQADLDNGGFCPITNPVSG
jgi:multiple sugar transport system substrate-binding protein